MVSQTILALKALGLYLSQFPGRKNLVWLVWIVSDRHYSEHRLSQYSESSPLAGSLDPFRGNRSYTIAIYDFALLLQSGNIAVYPVDVRGLAR